MDGCVTQATGTAEHEATEAMAKNRRSRSGKRITLGADKGYDTKAHVAALREARITPHVARCTALGISALTSAAGAAQSTPERPGMSQTRRKMVECFPDQVRDRLFGWGKQHGTIRKTKHRSGIRAEVEFLITMIGYNLMRLPGLIPS